MGDITDALDSLNIPLPLCISRLVKAPPDPASPTNNGAVFYLINKFGGRYNCPRNEIQQACNLARGSSDLVVILERPAPNHDYSVSFEKFVSSCRTLDAVNRYIKVATNNTRSIETVSVFDALTLKPNKKGGRPSNEECYSLLEKMLKAKKPKVVICCWSDEKARCSNEFVSQFMGGRFKQQPLRVLVNTEWEASVAVVRSFHPATAVCYKKHNPDYQILLIYHFITAFLELSDQIKETPLPEPLWLEPIKIRCRADIRSQKPDPLDKLRLSNQYAEAYNRAFDIIRNILGESRSLISSTKSPNDEIYLLLQRLKKPEYGNGSTDISKLYILWKIYSRDHPKYKSGLNVLINIAENQEWFDPKDDIVVSLIDEFPEKFERLKIKENSTFNATTARKIANDDELDS